MIGILSIVVFSANPAVADSNLEKTTYINNEFNYTVQLPATFTKTGYGGESVLFFEDNIDKWAINIYEFSEERLAIRTTDQVDLTADESYTLEPIKLADLEGFLSIAKRTNSPNWVFKNIILYDNEYIYIISNGAVQDSRFEDFYRSFKFLDPTDIFTDIPADHPNATAIKALKKRGVVQGYADGTFRPNNHINRAEFTTIIINTLQLPECENNFYISDVPEDSWYRSAVYTAVCFGYITGYPDKTFKPANLINTAEAAKIVSIAFGLEPMAKQASQHWYEPYIKALNEKNIIPATAKMPEHLLTRAEMAEMIYLIKRKDFVIK